MSPAVFGWTVDTAPPETTIGTHPDAQTNVTDSSFSFAGEVGASFECKLDSGVFVVCVSPRAYGGLADGGHSFSVRATDAAGNTDPSPALFAWTVDTVAPETTIDTHPGSLTNATGASFAFSSEPGVGFACKLDGGSFQGCGSPKSYDSLADGGHSFEVRATDAAGNADLSPALFSWVVDATPPDTSIGARPDALTRETSASFSFSSEPGVGFECRRDGAGFAPCTSPTSYTGLADGGHSFEVRATDAAGNTDPTPAAFSWTVDTTPPETTIDTHPGSLTNATGASFSFSSEPGAGFECKLDAGVFVACASPRTYSGLADGDHVFSVRASDAAGNTDPSPAAFSWTVDTVPPETSIDAHPDVLTKVITASFSFSSEPGASFECKLDTGSFGPCSSPQSYAALADGGHSVEVRATDGAGNTDPTPASFSWTLDTVPPDTSLDSHPVALTNATDASFVFSSEPAASFACKLDSGSFAACTSPLGYTGLGEGGHSFVVRATDPAGNTDPSPASFAWTVDTTPPRPVIDTHPGTPTNVTTAAFTFSSEAGASFACKLDGGSFAPCTSPQSTSGLADGGHSFSVRATDAAGNSDSVSFGWIVDTVPPDTSIESHPLALTKSNAASFVFSSEPGASFECSLDAGSFQSCTSPRSYDSLADGGHSFSVRATDAAGNTDPSPASFAWTVDTTPPETTIGLHPDPVTAATDASFALAAEAGASFECKLDTAAFAACTSPQSYSGLAEGGHSFEVRATDPAGNTDPTPASFAWTVDRTAPTVALTAPLGGTVAGPVVVSADASDDQAVAGGAVPARWAGPRCRGYERAVLGCLGHAW